MSPKDYFSREYIFQPLIFRGHVSFQGGIQFNVMEYTKPFFNNSYHGLLFLWGDYEFIARIRQWDENHPKIARNQQQPQNLTAEEWLLMVRYCWWFRNPKQPPGMYKTLWILGYRSHIHWWVHAGFLNHQIGKSTAWPFIKSPSFRLEGLRGWFFGPRNGPQNKSVFVEFKICKIQNQDWQEICEGFSGKFHLTPLTKSQATPKSQPPIFLDHPLHTQPYQTIPNQQTNQPSLRT